MYIIDFVSIFIDIHFSNLIYISIYIYIIYNYIACNIF